MIKNVKTFFAVGWRVGVGVVVLAGIGAFFYFHKGNDVGPTLTIHRSNFVKKVSVSGTVTPAHDVNLGFAAGGRVTGVYASVGQHVAAGTILAETENRDLIAAVAEKKAMLQQAKASLTLLLSGSTAQQIAVASTTLANARATLATAITSAYTTADDAVHNKTDGIFSNPRTNPHLLFSTMNFSLKTRVENERSVVIKPLLSAWAARVGELSPANTPEEAALAQENLTTVSNFLADVNAVLNQAVPDQTTSAATLAAWAASVAAARTSANAALTSLVNARAAYDSAQKNLALITSGPTKDAVAVQKAAIAAAEASVKKAQSALANTRIVAPFSGTITRMDAKVGEIASPNVPDVSMQSDGAFEIDAYVPEVSIAGIAVGDPASTTLDAYGPTVNFPAKVVSINPAQTMKDGVPTYKTTLLFTRNDPRIKSGMTANVTIVTGVLKNAIVIPRGVIGHNSRGAYVSVVTPEGKVVQRTITEGSSPALGEMQVLSGLTDGEKILLTPS